MSYDIYCYKSKSIKPNIEEARAIIENEEKSFNISQEQEAIMEKIAESLIEYNPRLKRFKLDYDEIVKTRKISMDEAKRLFNYIELNPPDDDNGIQITVDVDHVFITTPYWYEGDDAKNVFKVVSDYLKIIKKTTGYLVYDPQAEIVFDPEKNEFDNLEGYENIVRDMSQLAQQAMKENKKSRWKFWK